MKYAVSKRIAMASYYLEKSKIPISQIANMLSFSEGKYFSTVFKKHTGQTPREYRNNKYEIHEKNVSSLIESITK